MFIGAKNKIRHEFGKKNLTDATLKSDTHSVHKSNLVTRFTQKHESRAYANPDGSPQCVNQDIRYHAGPPWDKHLDIIAICV